MTHVLAAFIIVQFVVAMIITICEAVVTYRLGELSMKNTKLGDSIAILVVLGHPSLLLTTMGPGIGRGIRILVNNAKEARQARLARKAFQRELEAHYNAILQPDVVVTVTIDQRPIPQRLKEFFHAGGTK